MGCRSSAPKDVIHGPYDELQNSLAGERKRCQIEDTDKDESVVADVECPRAHDVVGLVDWNEKKKGCLMNGVASQSPPDNLAVKRRDEDTEITSMVSEKPSSEVSGQPQRQLQQQPKQQPNQQQYVADDDDYEFGGDFNYPMVGHGVSDDISVVSDLTIPTVSSGLHVPLEVGLGASRGAAWARRKKYRETMAKLDENQEETWDAEDKDHPNQSKQNENSKTGRRDTPSSKPFLRTSSKLRKMTNIHKDDSLLYENFDPFSSSLREESASSTGDLPSFPSHQFT